MFGAGKADWAAARANLLALHKMIDVQLEQAHLRLDTSSAIIFTELDEQMHTVAENLGAPKEWLHGG